MVKDVLMFSVCTLNKSRELFTYALAYVLGNHGREQS